MSSSLKKKIIIIGPAHPYRGGNSLFVSYVFDSLSRYFEVKIFNYKLLYPKFLFPGTTQYDKSNQVIKKAPNERVINSINPFNWFHTAKKLKKENADLIIFDWWHPFFGLCHFTISFLIKNKYRNKILFITENFVSHEGNIIDKSLTKIGLKNASKFLALSEIVERDLKEIVDDRKIYRTELPIYDCYKTEAADNTGARNELGFSDDDFVLLFFGYVRKYKGLDILLNSFKDISEDFPDARLLVVGEFYDDPDIYMKMIDNPGIHNKVKIINQFVPNEEVGKYYLASDLVILPYRSATQSGILNVAYGFNKPVLATRVGGLAEFIDDRITGIIVEPDSPDAITAGVKEFLVLREKINFGENIQAYVTQNKFVELPELFQRIVEESS